MTSTRVLVLLILAASMGCAGPTPSPEAERRIAELEKVNAGLRDRLETVETQLAVVLEQSGIHVISCSWPPPIDAEVLEVKPDLKLVVFNKGEKDGVKVGYVLDVYARSIYKGQVRVQEVQEATCTGVILHEPNPIARGDSATTSL